MPSQWNTDADRDLLLAIIDEDKLKNIQWHDVSASMTEKGYSFSHEACRQHFQKLRRESKKSRAAAVGGGGSSTGGTPRKQRVNTTPKSGKSAANGKAGYMTGPVQDDDEFAQFDQTPSKKRKFEKMKFEDVEDVPALRFKMENHEQIVDGQRYVDLEHEEYYD